MLYQGANLSATGAGVWRERSLVERSVRLLDVSGTCEQETLGCERETYGSSTGAGLAWYGGGRMRMGIMRIWGGRRLGGAGRLVDPRLRRSTTASDNGGVGTVVLVGVAACATTVGG